MPRLYREAPLNGISEGAGNVIVLDVLRAMQRQPDTIPALLAEARKAEGADRRLDAYVDRREDRLSRLGEFEGDGHQVVEIVTLALQGSLLVRHSTPAVADAFCATRLDGDWDRAFGALPSKLDRRSIIERAEVAASEGGDSSGRHDILQRLQCRPTAAAKQGGMD